MNQPIINPIYFYLIDIVETLDIGTMFISAFFGVVAFFILYVRSIGEEELKVTKVEIYLVISCFVFGLLAVLIPSKNAVISMIVANEITYDRLDLALEQSSSLKDSIKTDIIEIFESINKEDEK